MKQFTLTLVVFFLLTLSAYAQNSEEPLTWHTDMLEAQAISDSTDKPIFAFFTGSDWCGWCHKLQREVFAKKEFIDWANQNVVLVELDFPRSKEQPADLVKQNRELQQVFRVGGFPTIWMFYLTKDKEKNSFNINALGSLGYPSGAIQGKEQLKFLENANNILSKKTK